MYVNNKYVTKDIRTTSAPINTRRHPPTTPRKGKLKIIITVRDYAFQEIGLLCQEFSPQRVDVYKLNDEQIKDIIEFVKENNRALVIVAEEINKNIISTLVLNNIQKKLKVVVVRYSAIKFMKTGILEDLATLTHAKYPLAELKENYYPLTVNDLGQAEKIIVKKDKSTFIISKFVSTLYQPFGTIKKALVSLVLSPTVTATVLFSIPIKFVVLMVI